MSGLLRTVNESFTTNIAPVFFNLVVVLSVAFKVLLIFGFVVRTIRAHYPLRSVCTGMTIQVTNVFKSAVTLPMHALVCSFTMRDSVGGQLALEWKCFTTFIAFKLKSFMRVKMFGQ